MAEDGFGQALDIDSRDVTAWTNLGLCLSRLRREQEAMACFEKVRELSGLIHSGISYGDSLLFIGQVLFFRFSFLQK